MAHERTTATVLAAVVLSVLPHGGARAADAAKPFEVRQVALSAARTPYPPAARALNLPGKATLSCTAAADGSVRGCKVVGEDPPDWGFGAAALLLVDAINVGPGAADRQVQAPISFRLDPEELGPDPDLKTPGFFIPDDQIRWVERPASLDLVTTYPPDAVRRDIEGFVALACRVTAEGRLSPCAVMTEQPRDEGFDKAALALAAKFRMAPRLADGRPAQGGVIRQGLSWSLH